MNTEQACETFYPIVTGWSIHFFPGRSEQVQDFTQDVMLKVCKAWKPEMEQWDTEHFRHWLACVARNLYADRMRQWKKEQAVCDAYLQLSDEETIPLPVAPVVDVKKEKRVAETMAHLSARRREVLVLSQQEMSPTEIAHHLHIERDVINQRLYWAKQSFKREWERAA